MTSLEKRTGVVYVAMIVMISGFLGAQWLFPVYAAYRNGGLQYTMAALRGQYRSDLSVDSRDVRTHMTGRYAYDTQSLVATMYKLYVTYAVYTLADAGQLSLSGTLAGMSYSLDEYLDLMQSISDKERDTIPGDVYDRINRGQAVTK